MSSHARITWASGPNGGQIGQIHREEHGIKARTALFTISLSRHPIDEKNGTPWQLAHRLPFQQFTERFATVKDAQKYAERWLILAMLLLGFKPIMPTPEPVQIRYKDVETDAAFTDLGGKLTLVFKGDDTVVYRATGVRDKADRDWSVTRATFDKKFEVVIPRG